MTQDANNSDNNASSEAAIPRRPGRPKGLPKPASSGRQPGTPNRVTRDVREAAAKHGPKALQAFVKLLDNPDPKIVSVAAREILDRAYGKPVSPMEVAGPNGAPMIQSAMSDSDLARFVLFTIAKGEPSMLPARFPVKTVDQAPKPDPFAADRAKQAAEIAAATAEPPAPDVSEYDRAVAAQLAERALAIAECRPERPAPVWYDQGRRLRAGEDNTPRSPAPNYRHRPR